MKKLLTCFLLASAALLAACHSEKDNTLPPSALVAFQPSLNLQTLWQASVGRGSEGLYYRLHPAADEGLVFADSYDGTISAFDAKTGQVAWKVNLHSTLTSGVGAGGGLVFVSTGDANLVALSQKTGEQVWQTRMASEALAAPTYSRGLVFVRTIAGTLTEFSATDGHMVWRFDQNVPGLILHASSEPQTAGSLVIGGFANGVLAVLERASGKVVWEEQVALPQGQSPVERMVDITVNPIVVDGIVFIATYQGRIAAYNIQNGEMLWQYQLSSYAGMTAGQNNIYISDAEGRVFAFDQSTGAVVWKQEALLGREITGPVMLGHHVVVADGYGYLHVLSDTDGSFVARMKIGVGAITAPITYDGLVYVYTADGQVIAVRAI